MTSQLRNHCPPEPHPLETSDGPNATASSPTAQTAQSLFRGRLATTIHLLLLEHRLALPPNPPLSGKLTVWDMWNVTDQGLAGPKLSSEALGLFEERTAAYVASREAEE